MASFREQGSLGHTYNMLQADGGTLNRGTTPSPQSVGMPGSLAEQCQSECRKLDDLTRTAKTVGNSKRDEEVRRVLTDALQLAKKSILNRNDVTNLLASIGAVSGLTFKALPRQRTR